MRDRGLNVRGDAKARVPGPASIAGVRRRGAPILASAALVLVAALVLAGPASATKTRFFVETFGSAAQPTFVNSNGLALDPSNGDLLVIDTGGGASKAGTVSRYRADGTPDPFSALGTNVIDGKGTGQCPTIPADCDQTPQNGYSFHVYSDWQQVVVDHSGTATDGNIYVSALSGGVFSDFIDVFASDGHFLGQLTAAGGTPLEDVCGLAVDSGGNIYLAGWRQAGEKSPEGRIDKFDPSANPPLNTDHVATFATPEVVCRLAAGTGPGAGTIFGDLFYNYAGGGVVKLDADDGAIEGVIPQSGTPSVDPVSGHVFVGGHEFDAGGNSELSSFNVASNTGFGTASNGAIDRVYVTAGNKVNVLGPIVTIPGVATGTFEVIGDTSIRVKGTVTPDGEALTECFFEYDSQPYFGNPGKEGEPAHGQTAPCEAPNAAEISPGAGPVAAHADLTGLGGETAYHYRLVARNANAELYPQEATAVAVGADRVFKTPGKPAIKSMWATNVIFTEATLKATLNPENATTKYRFEWGLDSSYGNSSPEITLGTGGADHTVGFNLSGLEPATTYHYRLIAINAIGVSEGIDRQFTTFSIPTPPAGGCENEASRTGPSAALPDCRAYEVATPLDKRGDAGLGLSVPYVHRPPEEVSSDGQRLVYGSFSPFGEPDSVPLVSEFLSERDPQTGWSSRSITPPISSASPYFPLNLYPSYVAFSEDLCHGWVRTDSVLLLAPGATPNFPNLYRRSLCGQQDYLPLTTAAPIDVDPGEPNLFEYRPAVQGFSADSGTTVFRLSAALEGTGATTTVDSNGRRPNQLYAADAAGGLRLASVLPDTSAAIGNASVGESTVDNYEVRHAFSPDGSRLYWTQGVFGGQIYLRLNPTEPQSAQALGSAGGTGNLSAGSDKVTALKAAEGKADFSAGSATATLLETSLGRFVVGQPVSAPAAELPPGTTITEVSGPTLTLSAPAGKSGASKTISSKGPLPFAVGQTITGPGIPLKTTIVATAEGSLTLSANATQTQAAAPLSAYSECTEADKACTLSVSEAVSGAEARFQGASADGSIAFFSVGGGLYEFDAAAAIAHQPEPASLIAEGVRLKVMGASEDASRLYFASTEDLGAGPNPRGDEPVVGEPNLYLYEAGAPPSYAFIGTLVAPPVDATDSTETQEYPRPLAWGPTSRASRVSPDGMHAAFTSRAALTGNDNLDVASGEPDAEVYLYDAASGVAEAQLRCVSCIPSGARPAGRLVGHTDVDELWTASRIQAWQNPHRPSRALAEDGRRLFFESFDALLPQDTNGALDVYQWEAPGAGDCDTEDANHFEKNGGCLSLISSGQSPEPSEFIDASADGSDVFFLTGSSLLNADPGLRDIYDARVGGGFPEAPPPAPACEGEACQSPPEAPNDPTPASSSFEGAGNVVEPIARPCPKGKVRKHGRCVKKRKGKRQRRSHRAGHNRGAAR
jgi:hypothetical protein